MRLIKNDEGELFQATHLFDLKTDLGFNRLFEDFITEKREFIKNKRGQRVWSSWNESDGYRRKEIEISSTLKYTVVVVIDWNIDKSALSDLVNLANSTDEVNMFVLLNHIKDQERDEIDINMSEFAKLDAFIMN
ncbi:MAG: hypothetical protein IPP69_04455 [Flavobacteriales bacterium]|nr:hypothetical protein [Flavobacteriales bacterium]